MNITAIDKEYVAGTYGRFPLELVEGKGSIVKDTAGKEYIDLGSGIGVTCFGFGDEAWTRAVCDQAMKLQHVSNLYYTEPCARLAKLLCEKTGMKKVFFSNSGAEANEGIIKLTLKDKSTVTYRLASISFFREDLGDLIAEQHAAGIITNYEYEPATVWPWWVSILPYAGMLILFAVLWIFMMGQVGGKNGKPGSFAKARVKTPADTKQKVLFSDVAGAKEEKEEAADILEKKHQDIPSTEVNDTTNEDSAIEKVTEIAKAADKEETLQENDDSNAIDTSKLVNIPVSDKIDYQRIYDLYEAGYTADDISEAMQINVPTVCRSLHMIYPECILGEIRRDENKKTYSTSGYRRKINNKQIKECYEADMTFNEACEYLNLKAVTLGKLEHTIYGKQVFRRE